MIRIAVIEDEPADQAQIASCLKRYEEEYSQPFSVHAFLDPSKFLSSHRTDYDLIFMDIEMPPYNGIDIARQLRQIDSMVTLVFITNMEQFALSGYEVDASDFVVKPINYYRFSSMMKRALRSIAKRNEKEVLVRSANKLSRLRISQIYYVEVRDHLLVFHTDQGNLDSWGKLADLEEELAGYDFVRCSNSHLVNLRYVNSIDGGNVDVAGHRLPISQRKRKTFLASVTEYLGDR